MPAWKGIVGKGFRPDEFRAYVGGLSFTGWRPQFVVVHNTSAPRLSQWHSTPGSQRMLNLQNYYRDTKKWSAGPHLFVADDLIWVFTPLTTSGVHSPSWNAVSWGVEIVGEYQEEVFGGAIKANAVDALAILHQQLGLDPHTLRFHREDPLTSHKTCPGRNIVKPDLIAAVAARMVETSQGEHLATRLGAATPDAQPPAPGATVAGHGFLGWKPDIPDHRDYPYGAMRLALEQPPALPASVDLRPQCPPVYDQGQLNSCTANAIAASFEFLEIKNGNSQLNPSRLFIYYNERKLENDTGSDAGAYIRDGIKSIASTGICAESAWPYDVTKFADAPPDTCFSQALTYKALSYFRLNNNNINELKTCLAAGFPFVFGFAIYDSYFNADTNGGIVGMPGDEHQAGGHAVLAVGYDDATQRFTIQNSWGPNLGDRGYYYMPYQYLTSTSLADDFWTVRSITTAVASTQVIADDSDPVQQTLPIDVSMLAPAPVGLARDMEEAKKYLAAIQAAAQTYALTPSLICALGSRESGWGLGSDMKPKGPAGTGDWAPRNPSRFGYAMPPDGLGWGRGLLQIDYQLDFAKTGDWRDPRANIMYGCKELAGNVAYFTKRAASLGGVDPLRAAIAAYNCGQGNVNKALKNKRDVDHYTAGGDYSKDVLNRRDWFKQEGFDDLAPAGIMPGAPAGGSYTVHHGKHYRATVTLNWFEQQVATNAMIAGQFAQLGFGDVQVTGDGATRQATGLWNGPDTTVQLDPHLSDIVELG